MKDPRILLLEIVEAIESIESFVAGMRLSQFETDDKTSSAVVRKLEIIGEATKQLSGEFRDKFPAVPWSLMARMRDVLIHQYTEVDYAIVWKTIKESLPETYIQLRKILEELR